MRKNLFIIMMFGLLISVAGCSLYTQRVSSGNTNATPAINRNYNNNINQQNIDENININISCVGEGKFGNIVQNPNLKCCNGLKSLGIDYPDKNGSCIPAVPGGQFICANCGDGVCGNGENKCSCPADCK